MHKLYINKLYIRYAPMLDLLVFIYQKWLVVLENMLFWRIGLVEFFRI